MDSLITAAAQALARGDPLAALNWVALREDAPALALRGVAMARLGDFTRAVRLLRRAARAFGAKDRVSRARCVVAEAEIALVSRDLGWPTKTLSAAREILQAHDDRLNADYALHLEIRRLLILGHIDEAVQALDTLDSTTFPPAFKTTHELVVAGIAMRRLKTKTAKAALARADVAARQAGIPALMAEVEHSTRILAAPAARLITRDGAQLIQLEQVEAVLASKAFVIDACRFTVRNESTQVSLAKRPILFTLVRILAEAWPGDVPRHTLIARAFRLKLDDDSHRARLRVEIGRLRTALRALAEIRATKRGYILTPCHAEEVVVLAQPVEEKHAAVLALLADGEAWSSSALALVLETSQRTVQRALDALMAESKVQPFGQGRGRRWLAAPVPGFTTTLLLPGPLLRT